jgi:lysophospholipase L1-like esterase
MIAEFDGEQIMAAQETQRLPPADPKSILCFGDSLTWGFDPRGGQGFVRYGFAERWTQRLQGELGPAFHVIEDGLNGRTTVFDDPVIGGMNGLAQLPTSLKVHMPLDLVVFFLGTNDTKRRFGVNGDEIARSLGRLLDVAAKSGSGPGGGAPKMLVLVPPIMGDVASTWLGPMFDAVHGAAALERLRETYPAIAGAFGAHCFDLNQAVGPGRIDGIHFDPDALQPVAAALAEVIRSLVAAATG